MANKKFQFESPEQKASYVQDMFDRIAPKYDRMNRIMTLGRDQAWRRILIDRANIRAGSTVLDIATGTADIALEAERAGAAEVIAADFSRAMLRHASRKLLESPHANGRIHLAAADGMSLPFQDENFDAVVTGFSLRNVANLDHFLRELVRVTRSGGYVATLEIFSPRLPVFRELFGWYFGRLVPKIGSLISKTEDAYSYLPYSVTIFVSPQELEQKMREAGLEPVGHQSLMLGTIAVHYGRRR